MNISEILELISKHNASLCLVTKNYDLQQVRDLLNKYPKIKIIAENRWPDCEEKFRYFKNYEKHFIGKLQSNKVNKIVPFVDMIQSVDSLKLLNKINRTAQNYEKKINFLFQINISMDPKKSGIDPKKSVKIVSEYLKNNFNNVNLCGLMTMGEAADMKLRQEYYIKFKQLFDLINEKFFSASPLKTLSMGTSNDFKIALEQGATMVRLGQIMFKNHNKIR